MSHDVYLCSLLFKKGITSRIKVLAVGSGKTNAARTTTIAVKPHFFNVYENLPEYIQCPLTSSHNYRSGRGRRT